LPIAAELSLFRRPLPSTNLTLLNTVMWDARETRTDAASRDCIIGSAVCFADHALNLGEQANGATVGHAEAAEPLTQAQRESIVDFELGLFTAQIFDAGARFLGAGGARGGVRKLAGEDFYFGINDFTYGDYRRAAAFDPAAFSLFGSWEEPAISRADNAGVLDARRTISRGEKLFNTKQFPIKGVAGFNDVVGASEVRSTCSACHNAPNSGGQSVPGTMDIGVSDLSQRTPDLPVYVLRNTTTGETRTTTDPGRGLVTGKWDDIGKFKVPSLRALAARPPFFHNGSAADLAAVVEFYDRRFSMGLTAEETADLVAFLQAL
jgi:cytochrome c peroxidase